jgi:hypothetical protein
MAVPKTSGLVPYRRLLRRTPPISGIVLLGLGSAPLALLTPLPEIAVDLGSRRTRTWTRNYVARHIRCYQA